MPHMTKVNCKKCKEPFEARTADVKRGWGKFCSKSCSMKGNNRNTPYGMHSWQKRQKPSRIIKENWDGTQEFYANFSNEENTDI